MTDPVESASRAGRPRLSVVVPVYNERDNVDPLLDEVVRELDRIGVPYEVILVDDGSTDGTAERLDARARDHDRIRVLHLARNSGQSAAFCAGWDAARGEYLVTLDADLQNDPADISRLMEWIPQVDMVAGYRRRRQDTWLRRVSGAVANRVRRGVLDDGIRDTGCSLKLFRRELVRTLPRFNGMHRFLPLLVQMAGGSVTQVPVNHRPRRAGRAKYNVRNRLFRGLLDLAGVWWLRRRHLEYHVIYEAPGSPAERPRQHAEEER